MVFDTLVVVFDYLKHTSMYFPKTSIRILSSWHAVLQNDLKFKSHFLHTQSIWLLPPLCLSFLVRSGRANRLQLGTHRIERHPGGRRLVYGGPGTGGTWACSHRTSSNPRLSWLSPSRPSLYQRCLRRGEPNQFSPLIYVWMKRRVMLMNSPVQPAGCRRTPAISASVVFPSGGNELWSDFGFEIHSKSHQPVLHTTLQILKLLIS